MEVIFGKLQPVDILAIGAHPDDIELGCGGTLIKHLKLGYKVGIVDASYGELGTNGTPHIRKEEATESAKFMGASFRVILGIPDGSISRYSESNLKELVKIIRISKPSLILTTNEDRHPDHTATMHLTYEAAFLAKLHRYPLGEDLPPHNTEFIFRYIQFIDSIPSFVVDISEYIDAKVKLVMCHRSQFNPDGKPTILTTSDFTEYVKSRARFMGQRAFCKYGEGFLSRTPVQIDNLLSIASNRLLPSSQNK